MGMILTAVFLILLVAASAFFSSSETAILSVSKVQLRQLIKDRIPGAKRLASLKEDIDKVLVTILIGNNFVNNLASSAATALAVSIFGQSGVGIATVVMTCVIILFGEVLPKTLAVFNPVKISLKASLPLLVLEKIMFVFVWIFSFVTNIAPILRILHARKKKSPFL